MFTFRTEVMPITKMKNIRIGFETSSLLIVGHWKFLPSHLFCLRRFWIFCKTCAASPLLLSPTYPRLTPASSSPVPGGPHSNKGLLHKEPPSSSSPLQTPSYIFGSSKLLKNLDRDIWGCQLICFCSSKLKILVKYQNFTKNQLIIVTNTTILGISISIVAAKVKNLRSQKLSQNPIRVSNSNTWGITARDHY